MKKHSGMRPQDVLVLLKVMTWKTKYWRNIDIAHHLLISPSEVSEALNRNKIAGLIESDKRSVNLNSLKEFLLYGIRYVFPVEPGRLTYGIATAHSAYPIFTQIASNETFVWPYPHGDQRGQAIEPLYKTVPMIVKKDKLMYEFLVIIDTFRLGRMRHSTVAKRALQKRLYMIQRGLL